MLGRLGVSSDWDGRKEGLTLGSFWCGRSSSSPVVHGEQRGACVALGQSCSDLQPQQGDSHSPCDQQCGAARGKVMGAHPWKGELYSLPIPLGNPSFGAVLSLPRSKTRHLHWHLSSDKRMCVTDDTNQCPISPRSYNQHELCTKPEGTRSLHHKGGQEHCSGIPHPLQLSQNRHWDHPSSPFNCPKTGTGIPHPPSTVPKQALQVPEG